MALALAANIASNETGDDFHAFPLEAPGRGQSGTPRAVTLASDLAPQQERDLGDGQKLLLPEFDEPHPEVSIVVPAVNEQLTIATFVQWCHEGLRSAGVRGEILIIDSSTDRTAELARAGGARVLQTPRRGLGRAYIDAVPFIRGEYVIMGDADCTYDFRKIAPFVDALKAGNEFAMGSRWKGSIEPGAMPFLHRYLGTPITTWILNRVYGSRFTDIHCGMRALRRDCLDRMGLTSQSWEYASEMVLKSVRMELRTVEVPVTFFKDRDGRLSHHKRSGWFSPFQAAWINLKAMFIYRAEFFALKPGLVLLSLGLLLTLPLSLGPFTVGRFHFQLHWMLLGLTLSLIGLQSFFFGCLAQVLTDYSGRARARWTRVFSYTRAVIVSVCLFLLGLGLAASLVVQYLSHNLTLPANTGAVAYLAVTGSLLMITGFSLFCFTLVLHATSVRYGRSRTES